MDQISSIVHDQSMSQGAAVPISMRIREACQFTGISRSTLYVLIATGEIQVAKIGSTTLVLTESLHKLIERNRVAKR